MIVKLNIYKWYELHLQLTGGNLYKKMFYLCNKQEHINFVNMFRKQVFECHIKSNLHYKSLYIEEEISADYSDTVLSIT